MAGLAQVARDMIMTPMGAIGALFAIVVLIFFYRWVTK